MTKVRTVEWKRGRVVMLDQRLLPNREVYRLYRDANDVILAIKELVVRGAPAIGVAAAMGLALGARSLSSDRFARDFEKLSRALRRCPSDGGQPLLGDRAHAPGGARERAASRRHPANLARARGALHLRGGPRRQSPALACTAPPCCRASAPCSRTATPAASRRPGIGTALGVIVAARDAGKKISVFADETRPILQGARLTAWELRRERIPVTVITDNMAGHFMQRARSTP